MIASVLVMPVAVVTAAPDASVTIVQQAFTVVGDSSWRVVVDLGGAVGENLNIDVVSHRRTNTRSELDAAIGGRLPGELDRLRFPVAKLARNSAGRVVVSVPTVANESGDADLLVGTTGIYPVTIELRNGETLLGSATTFIHHVQADDDLAASADGALQIASIASLADVPALGPDGTTTPSKDFAEQLTNLTDAFTDTTAGAFVALQGDQVAAAGTGSFEALRKQAKQHTMVAAPFIALDPSAAATAGLGELFAAQLRAGEDTVAAAVGVTPDRGVMVIDDKLTAGGAVLLRDVGVRGAVLTPRAADASGLRGQLDSALTYRAIAADGSALVIQGIDAGYAAVLDDTTRPALPRAVAVAAGLVLQREALLSAGKDLSLVAVALGTNDGRPADADVMQQLERYVETSNFLELQGAPRPAATETTSDVVDLPVSSNADLVAAKTLYDKLTPRVNSTMSMLRDDDPRREIWPALLTTLLSSRADDALRSRTADKVRSATKTVLGSLSLPTTSRFTLSSRKSELRLQVRNAGDTPLRAIVRFRSAKLKFSQPRQVIEVPAGASSEVMVEVEARSNGSFPVTVQLLTPRGDVPLGDEATITANVSALAGLGQVVTVTFLLVLLTWWAHNWRTKRRRAIESAAKGEHPSRLVGRSH